MTKVMALDLGRFTGVCIGDTETGIKQSFTFDLLKGCTYHPIFWKNHKDFNKTRQDKMSCFKTLIEFHKEESGIDVIVYERPFVRGHAATRQLWGYAGIADSFELPTYDFAVTSIKKFATGKGKAEKEDMIQAAQGFLRQDTGKEKKSEDLLDHEADAICVFQYYRENKEALEEPPKPKKKRKKKNG